MKKKAMCLAAILCFVFVLGGCGEMDVELPYDYDLSEYVTLGEYKGIEVLKVEPQEVTDESVELELTYILSENPVTTDVAKGEALEYGDTANLDYEGKIDGETFEGGSAEGFDLALGSGQFIPGFEDGLVGKNVGEKVVLPLTFPDDYHNAEFAGKAVEFTVTVNSATREAPAELTDDFVKKVSEKSKTVDEFKEEVKANLEEQAEESARQAMKSSAWQTAVANSEVKAYPEKEIEDYTNELNDYYHQYAQTYGMEFEDVLETMDMTEAEFDEQAKKYAEAMVGDELVLYSIIKAEDIALTKKEYEKGAQEYMELYGYETLEDLENAYTKEIVYESILWDKTLDFLLDNAVLVDELSTNPPEEGTAGQDAGAEGEVASGGGIEGKAVPEGSAE